MKILVCGDSFAITDPAFPGLHWTDKILNHSADFELCNLAAGGASNAMIALQLMQGLQLRPDFVIFSFTTEGRYEIDQQANAKIRDVTAAEFSNYQKTRWTTTAFDNIDAAQRQTFDRWQATVASQEFEWFKDYMFVMSCLQTTRSQGIRFAYSLGGFEFQRSWQNNLKSLFASDFISELQAHELKTNLWYYKSNTARALFHVDDDDAQSIFAAECVARINHQYGNDTW